MSDTFAAHPAGYVLYHDMIQRLSARFPEVPLWRIEAIAYSENEAMTGGLLHVVPEGVEHGTAERLGGPASPVQEANAHGAED
ncbi:hypothetical protein [Microbacterium sp. NPDC055683]